MQIHEFGASEADIVLIQPVDVRELPGMEQELAVIRENIKEDFRMIALCVEDWNCDLSPWPAPPVFGSEGFSGGAERTAVCPVGGLSERCVCRDRCGVAFRLVPRLRCIPEDA